MSFPICTNDIGIKLVKSLRTSDAQPKSVHFGVKILPQSSNNCKKNIEDDDGSLSEEDHLEIIDYPYETIINNRSSSSLDKESTIIYCDSTRKEDIFDNNFLFTKKLEQLTMKKIEKPEENNLTLSDNEDRLIDSRVMQDLINDSYMKKHNENLIKEYESDNNSFKQFPLQMEILNDNEILFNEHIEVNRIPFKNQSTKSSNSNNNYDNKKSNNFMQINSDNTNYTTSKSLLSKHNPINNYKSMSNLQISNYNNKYFPFQQNNSNKTIGNTIRYGLYQKKRISQVPHLNNIKAKRNSFDSISFLSNISSNTNKIKQHKNNSKSNYHSSNVTNNITFTDVIPRNKVNKNNKLKTRKSKKTNQNKTLTTIESNLKHQSSEDISDINEIKLMKNYQQLKQFEQFMEFKEMEKIKNLIELNQKANLFNMKDYSEQMTIKNINENDCALVNQQFLMNHLNEYNVLPIKSKNSNIEPSESSTSEAEPKACNYCEEIYKYLIINNQPIKFIKCLYCNRIMNRTTLDYYIDKYKNDVNNKIINDTNKDIDSQNSKLNTILHEIQLQINNQQPLFNKEGNIKETHNSKKYDFPQDNQFNQEQNKFNLPEQISEIKINNSNQTENKIKKAERIDIEISPPITKSKTNNALLSSNNVPQKKENQIMLNTNNNTISLAEAFRTKRLKIINNIEKRANSIKDSKTFPHFETDNIEMQNIYKHFNKSTKNLRFSQTFSTTTDNNLNNNYSKRSVSEPPKELLNRLIKGEKVKMSQKEMIALNKRLYNKLTEMKGQKDDEGRKEELTKLNKMKKEFTNNLKNKVVNQYRAKNSNSKK